MPLRRSRLIAALALATTIGGVVPALALPEPLKPVADPVVDAAGTAAGMCDPIDPAHCLLPFPNDFFTVADPSTATGRRIEFSPLAMPRNTLGKPIDPTEWNRNDGFSPGAMVITYVPGIDLKKTWGTELDQIQDLALSTGAKAPIAIIDAETGKRHPFWSELDTHPESTDEPTDRQALILRPAVNFEEGRRYIVALRNLKDASGATIPRGDAFDAFVTGTATGDRAEHMNEIFDDLESIKGKGRQIKRSELYLAWDFTVASADNLAGRVLHMRDAAFADLGDSDLANGVVEGNAPDFDITKVTEKPDGRTRRRVEGTVSVPNFLTFDAEVEPRGDGYQAAAAPGARLLYLDGPGDQKPNQNPVVETLEVPFVCNIPATASAENTAHAVLYGHGLLGARQEANGSSTHDLRGHNFAPCAVDWMGMSFSDLTNVASILVDMSNFPSLADRAQQGFLNWMFLGRALVHPEGLTAQPEFKLDGAGLVDGSRLFYNGNSQGGIMGGALTALAPDFTTSVLGVPGMNYSTLLNRSSDWEGEYDAAARIEKGISEQEPEAVLPPYSYPAYQAYPDKLEQQIMFALIQMIWDRGESNAYAHHMTDDPYPNTPAHQVLLQVAFSDHQVANIAAEVMGRTIGAQLTNAPVPVPDNLHWSVDPSFGFENSLFETPGLSHLVYWHSTDRGLTTPPNGNVPPHIGEDPHSDPRKDYFAVIQEVQFLLDGTLADVCGGTACVTTKQTRDQ